MAQAPGGMIGHQQPPQSQDAAVRQIGAAYGNPSQMGRPEQGSTQAVAMQRGPGAPPGMYNQRGHPSDGSVATAAQQPIQAMMRPGSGGSAYSGGEAPQPTGQPQQDYYARFGGGGGGGFPSSQAVGSQSQPPAMETRDPRAHAGLSGGPAAATPGMPTAGANSGALAGGRRMPGGDGDDAAFLGMTEDWSLPSLDGDLAQPPSPLQVPGSPALSAQAASVPPPAAAGLSQDSGAAERAPQGGLPGPHPETSSFGQQPSTQGSRAAGPEVQMSAPAQPPSSHGGNVGSGSGAYPAASGMPPHDLQRRRSEDGELPRVVVQKLSPEEGNAPSRATDPDWNSLGAMDGFGQEQEFGETDGASPVLEDSNLVVTSGVKGSADVLAHADGGLLRVGPTIALVASADGKSHIPEGNGGYFD